MHTLILSLVVVVTPVSPDPACANAPAGTTCVPAGTSKVGEGAAQRDVVVDRFFFDDHDVTATELALCEAAKACEPTRRKKGADVDAAVLVDWAVAERYCAFAGKRLPSEAEWETAAARGLVSTTTTTQWTNSWLVAPPLCATASAPLPRATKEWLPPAVCGSIDRLDACDGAALCGSLAQKIMKDPREPTARIGAVTIQGPTGVTGTPPGTRTAALRCATSTTTLTGFPSAFSRKRPAPPTLAAPSAEELAAFNDVTEDTLDTPLCDKIGRSFVNCRDPRSYLKTNEPRQDVVIPYVASLGGGYTGVGSDQNYTLAALAASQWVWLFDYDPNVVNWHKVLRALILSAPTPREFIDRLEPKNSKSSRKIVSDTWADSPDRETLINLLASSSSSLLPYYREQMRREWTWLGTPEGYTWVRDLYLMGRMRAFKGNMLDKNTMQGIAAAAKKLKVPMRIYYPSNAHEFWVFTDQYRSNVRALPFDERSIVVQTISSLTSGFDQRGYWHYNVQYGFEQQRLLSLPGYTREKQLLYHRVKTDTGELTISGLPSTLP
ncbi:MAG: SUMF1/EgtB/PvdO family nonheme iron enzyme [Deltaproteobacteria bacterium]|nr:SUMF1/EgtB/PvdO family nonheme iron enzyme [Deltaproteobacteria bacterium]